MKYIILVLCLWSLEGSSAAGLEAGIGAAAHALTRVRPSEDPVKLRYLKHDFVQFSPAGLARKEKEEKDIVRQYLRSKKSSIFKLIFLSGEATHKDKRLLKRSLFKYADKNFDVRLADIQLSHMKKLVISYINRKFGII